MKNATSWGALALALASVHCGAEAPDRTSPGSHPRGDVLVDEEADCAHRGPVEVPFPSIDERRFTEKFQRRNGADWRLEFDSLGFRATRFADGGAIKPPHPLGEAEVQARALAFVTKNAGLLELSPAEANKLEAHVDPNGRRVELRGRFPRAEYEAFPSVERYFYIIVNIEEDGRVGLLWSRLQDVPSFKLCTKPLLGPTDPRLHAAVIGTELSFFDFTGVRRSAGKVEARDIGSTSLEILVQGSRSEGSVRLTLVYAVHVSKRAGGWTFYVDADTGQFVALRQNFDT